jgi:hypothetical protein
MKQIVAVLTPGDEMFAFYFTARVNNKIKKSNMSKRFLQPSCIMPLTYGCFNASKILVICT